MNDFVQGDGEVRVRAKDGSFRPVPTPVGFSDEAFRNAVAAFYTFYLQYGRTPTTTELHKSWPKIPVSTYSALYVREEFRQALEYRGVAWDPEQGLSLEQHMAIIKMSDPSDRRSQAVKLKELGIPVPRWQAWLKHPLFAQAWKKRAEDVLQEGINPALIALSGNAASGDLQSTKLLLEMTGRWNPSQQSLEDARMVVNALIEIISEEVKDTGILTRIMDRARARVAGYDLQRQRELES